MISDAVLVVMTQMIFKGRREEKEVLVRIVMHLLCPGRPVPEPDPGPSNR